MQTPKKSFDSSFIPVPRSAGSCVSSPEDSGRFIPNRGSSNFKELFAKTDVSDSPQAFSNMVHQGLFGGESKQSSVLRYSPQPTNKENMPPLFQLDTALLSSPRHLPKTPFKILDAPELKDDFYVDLVSWSRQDVLSVALNAKIYLWNASNSQIAQLSSLTEDSYASVSWDQSGQYLAAGTEKGHLQVFDVSCGRKIIEKTIDYGRIGCLAWHGSMLTAGTRDGYLVHSDIRASDLSAEIKAHKQEVCGVKWNENYLASGGNDNKIKVWNSLNPQPAGVLTGHTAAVKALGWDPHQPEILASGGGSSDKTVRLWNVLTFQEVARADSASQVCKLAFSQNSHELVTAHGYSSFSVIVWKLPRLEQVGVLSGHTKRVLYLEVSPSGENVVTGAGAGDETLRFWNLFPKVEEKEQPGIFSLTLDHIR